MKASVLYKLGEGEFTVICDQEMMQEIMNTLSRSIIDAAQHGQVDSVIELANQFQMMRDEINE